MSIQQDRGASGDGSAWYSGSGAGAPDRGHSNGDGSRNGASGGAEERLANALGWLSLGLGLAGLAIPGQVARMIGVRDDDDNRNVLRMVGAREIVSGVGILTQSQPVGWVWSRVAGDMMDLALLSSAHKDEEVSRDRLAAATAAVVGIAVVDLYCGQQLSKELDVRTQMRVMDGDVASRPAHGIPRVRAITINRPPEEVYGFWRNLENLPRFMNHLECVDVRDERWSHWRARGPAGISVSWDSEIVEDRPNELIAWRSSEDSTIYNSGRVEFRPALGGRATEVRVEMEYNPPGGFVGAKVAQLFGKEPKQQLADDLRTFKQVLETGEIVRSDGALFGAHFPQRPAQPPTSEELARAGMLPPGLEQAQAT